MRWPHLGELFVFLITCLSLLSPVSAQTERLTGTNIDLSNFAETVEDNFTYYGFARYLGGTLPVSISENGKAQRIKPGSQLNQSGKLAWVGFRGRFNSILVRVDSSGGTLTKSGFKNPTQKSASLIYKGRQDHPHTEQPRIVGLKYIQLPRVLRWLSLGMEKTYELIVAIPFIGWWTGLIVFAILVKILMWPISRLISKWQDEANAHRNALTPLHKEIKATLKGEEAHNALMQTYKTRNITPFYTLKPLLATALTFPFLIAIFNMLGENAQLIETPFLWVDSLAYPDRLAKLPFELPFFGPYLNLFPFLMAVATALTPALTRKLNPATATASGETSKIVLMALLFFFVFYNFPSGMIFYWTLSIIIPSIYTAIKAYINYLLNRQ